MGIAEALILGLVQGVTEFLPISSSGHLVIARSIIGSVKEPGLLFEVLLHLGTLMAVLLYFRREVSLAALSLTPWGEAKERTEGRQLALAVVIGTLPTVVIALLFKDTFEELFHSVQIVSVMLLVTGLLLFLSDRVKAGGKAKVGVKDALLIGVVQGIAIIPGISRSGSTIAAGIFRGVEGQGAATFSFMLSIPAILGAAVLESRHLDAVNGAHLIPFAAGIVAAAVSGFLSIKFLMRVVAGRNLRYFAFYCWGVGSLGLLLNR